MYIDTFACMCCSSVTDISFSLASALRGLSPCSLAHTPTHTQNTHTHINRCFLSSSSSLLHLSVHSQSIFGPVSFFFLIFYSFFLFYIFSLCISLYLFFSLSLSLPLLLPLLGCLQAVRALQLQRVGSCDALLVTATAAGGEEEDGTGMELTQLLDRIRAQCEQSRLPSPGERHLGLGTSSNSLPSLVGPSRSGAGAASRTHRGALSEVCIHCNTFSYRVFLPLSCCSGLLPARHTLKTTPGCSIDTLVFVFDWSKMISVEFVDCVKDCKLSRCYAWLSFLCMCVCKWLIAALCMN